METVEFAMPFGEIQVIVGTVGSFSQQVFRCEKVSISFHMNGSIHNKGSHDVIRGFWLNFTQFVFETSIPARSKGDLPFLCLFFLRQSVNDLKR